MTLTMQEITQNLFLFTQEKSDLELDGLRLKVPRKKPLVVILGWLGSKLKNLQKFAQIYATQDFDVLVAQCFPWQVLWPKKGACVVASDLVNFLELNDSYSDLIVHGFSVGCFLWSQVLMHLKEDFLGHEKLIKRIKCQIWDSIVGVPELPNGVGMALFRKNEKHQKKVRDYLNWFLRNYRDEATALYEAGGDVFHATFVHAPALLLNSKVDPIGTLKFNLWIKEGFLKQNIKVTWKTWEDSPHVEHFKKHKKEYTEMVYKHLEENNLLPQPEKLKAKL